MTTTIDLTPTWTGVLPILIAGIENGTAEGRKIAIDELSRMARAADAVKDSKAAIEQADKTADALFEALRDLLDGGISEPEKVRAAHALIESIKE